MRLKKMKASNAAHFMPLYAYWTGNARPVCFLNNRDGVPFALDPFDPHLPNYNGIILGQSGGGKSFTLLQLALMFHGLKENPKIIWIDNGASSQQVIEALEGQFINLDIDSDNLCLNMFDLPPREFRPGPSKIKLILAVLESILKDEEKQGLPKGDKALLEEAIFSVYEKVKDRIPILKDLRNILKGHPSQRMNEYACILYSWTDSVYGNFLNGKTNVDLSKNLITIEVKGLDAYPDLQNVLLLLFTDFIRKEAAANLSHPYLLFIDEGWKLFETPCGSSFAIEAYRTFRKFYAGIWIITQNYKDILAHEHIANAILPNTTQVGILPQKKIDWEDFGKRLGLTEAETELAKSLKVKKGEFSELFYIQNENKTVLKIVSDPVSYYLCSSDGLDKEMISRMKERFPKLNTLEIIQKIVKKGEAL